MDEFNYRHASLYAESLPIADLAQRFGTPLYVYSATTLRDHYHRLSDAFAALEPTVCFSVKSCSNLAILRLLRECGAGFDIVSGGELARVLEIGADPDRVVLAGVGKRDDEIRAALDARIGWFNAESEAELDAIAAMAAETGSRPRVALRVNPDVDPHTHQYTTTGTKATKFGVDIERAREIFSRFGSGAAIDLCGLHVHLGSPVQAAEPYVEALKRTLRLVEELTASGCRIDAINIGGGFGAHYDGSEAPPAKAYADSIVPLLSGRRLRILIEPGRSIAANAGVLISRVLYTKAAGGRRFAIVDAAITELIRPALYGAFHFVWPVRPAGGLIPPARARDLSLPGCELMDVVGPVCESGDFLAKDRKLPPVTRGDLLCIFSTGAYGFSMSSQYNSRPRAPEVLVEGSDVRLIRRRETYEDLVAAERVEVSHSRG